MLTSVKFDTGKDMEDAMRTFMDKCQPQMEQIMMDATTDAADAELLRLVITEAIRYAQDPKDGSYVKKALKIRAGAFLIASSPSMHGDEKLGVQACHHRTPSYFKYPLPTVLEYQIDTLA